MESYCVFRIAYQVLKSATQYEIRNNYLYQIQKHTKQPYDTLFISYYPRL